MMESDKRTIDSTRSSAQVAFESSSFNFSHPDVRLSRRICAARCHGITRAGSRSDLHRISAMGEGEADLRPKRGQHELVASALLHGIDDALVLPGVDERAVDRLLLWENVLKPLDQITAALLDHRCQDRRHVEDFRHLGEPNDVVDDHCRLVAVQVGELVGLMVDQHEDAALRAKQRVEAGLGRVRAWKMRNRKGSEAMLEQKARIVANDPEAICQIALRGLGVALIAVPFVLPHLKSGALQRILPDWYSDQGAISLYFTSQKLLPAKTRAFVDHITEAFREQKLAKGFSASG